MKHHTLSRTAERIYWLGRYLERADSTARLVNVNANLLIDLPIRLPLGWKRLVQILGSTVHFDELFDKADEHTVVRFLTSDKRNPGSIVNSLHFARENARTVREMMPRVTYEYINELYLFATQALVGQLSRTRRQQALDGVLAHVQQIDGFLSRTMLHDNNWSFLRLGQFIERADMTTHIIDVRSAELLHPEGPSEPFEQLQWRSVLRSMHAMQAYRASAQQPVEQSLVLEFLFKNRELPRSYSYCLDAMRNALRNLPRRDRPLRSCNRAIRHLKGAPVELLTGPALHAFIDECQAHLLELNESIHKTYFHARLRLPKKPAKSSSKRRT